MMFGRNFKVPKPIVEEKSDLALILDEYNEMLDQHGLPHITLDLTIREAVINLMQLTLTINTKAKKKSKKVKNDGHL